MQHERLPIWPGDAPRLRVRAVRHQDSYDLSSPRALPPIGSPERYMEHDMTRDAYEALPQGKWDCDDEGRITRIDVEPAP